MTIQQIVQLVSSNKAQQIIFFREGNFRKCYNQHAMYFTQQVKAMKVHSRFYKNISVYIHSMGFPETALDKYVHLLKQQFQAAVLEHTPGYMVLSVQWREKLDYAWWQETKIREKEAQEQVVNKLEQANLATTLLPAANTDEQKLAKMIAHFPLEKATPLDAFNFLQKLKKISTSSA